MSTEIRRFFVLREYPCGGRELAPVEAPHLRVSLWEGPHQPRPPSHPSLGVPLGSIQTDSGTAWLETRPVGSLLSELLPLSAVELAVIFAGLARGVEVLTQAGLTHGWIDAEHIVVGGDGRGQLIGMEQRKGSDIEQLLLLLADCWPEDSLGVPTLPTQSGSALADSLTGWMKSVEQGFSPFELGARSYSRSAGIPEHRQILELEVSSNEGAFDEVAFDIGPDPAEGGILDRWQSTSNTAWTDTREWTFAGTGPYQERRRALVARMVSPPMNALDEDRFLRTEGTPVPALGTLLADEALDPLPLPDGVIPALPAELLSQDGGGVELTAVTNTVTRITALSEEFSKRHLWGALLVVLIAAGLGAWVFYRFFLG